MPDNLTPDDLVRREVHYCVSSLVAMLAGGCGYITFTIAADQGLKDLRDLTDRAQELAAPIDDWEEAATQAGWIFHSDDTITHPDHPDATFTDAEQACQLSGVDEPYYHEVYEHWIVSDWLADKLEARGEKVDRDFAGMTVWARTTTGQAIACDSVIESICRDLPGEIEAALAAINTPKVEG